MFCECFYIRFPALGGEAYQTAKNYIIPHRRRGIIYKQLELFFINLFTFSK